MKRQLSLFFGMCLLAFSALGQGSGNAANFNGSSYIDLDSSFRTISFPVTITYWVKKSSSITGRVFSANNGCSGYSGIHSQILPNGSVEFFYGDGGGFSIGDRRSWYAATPQPYTDWVHYALVANSLTSVNIYVNGISMATTTAGTGSMYYQCPTGNGAFGRLLSNLGWEYLTGQLDDFTIWDKALTDFEVKRLVCRKTAPSKSQLLGYFNFDVVTANQVVDLSPNGFVGNLINGVTTPISGAAIGDTSYYSYAYALATVPPMSVTLSTSQQLEVANLTTNTKGIQVYEVFSAPNSTTGLPAGANSQTYFGVYLAIFNNVTQSYQLKLSNFTSTKQLYKRDANDDASWVLVNPISTVGGVATFPTDVRRQEYYIYNSQNCKLDLGPDVDICAPVNFWLKDNFYHPSKSYSWSGGSTADSLQITAAGTYSVIMDSAGCLKYDTIVVSEKSVNVDLGPDVNLCAPFSIWVKDLHFHPSKNYTWNGSTVADSIQITSWQQIVVEVDSAGCSSFDTIVISASNIDLDLGPDITICSNQSVWIKDLKYNQAKTYTWGSGLVADSILLSSAQQVTVQADSAGCSAFDTLIVTVSNYPPPQFDSIIEKCVENDLFVEFTEGDYSFLWPNGSTFNSYTIRTETQIQFYTISPCGDSTIHVINVVQNVCDAPCYIFVPNVFTPNGDNKNDDFLIGVNCDITSFSIKIFNRWGNIVYESGNPYFNWDGTFEGNKLNEGVYTYVIEYSGFDKVSQSKHGMIHLLK